MRLHAQWALLAFLLAAACGGGTIPRPTAEDASRAQRTWSGTRLADLERGRSLYLARCTGCHRAFEPGAIAPDKWPEEVREMSARAKLGAAETQDIVRYVVTLSRAAHKP